MTNSASTARPHQYPHRHRHRRQRRCRRPGRRRCLRQHRGRCQYLRRHRGLRRCRRGYGPDLLTQRHRTALGRQLPGTPQQPLGHTLLPHTPHTAPQIRQSTRQLQPLPRNPQQTNRPGQHHRPTHRRQKTRPHPQRPAVTPRTRHTSQNKLLRQQTRRP
ncbi:hypothetical protein ACRAWF_29210, partial [Streptomyces sp. L7]